MTAAPKHSGSQRLCVGCGTREDVDALLRWFIGPDGSAWPDWTGRSASLGGRGAYTHCTRTCIERALERGGFARAFKSKVERRPADVLYDRVFSLGRELWYSRLGLAARAGKVVAGQHAVRDAIRIDDVGLIVLASDAGGDVRRRMLHGAEHGAPIPLLDWPSGADLGAAVGRSFLSVLGVRRSTFARELLQLARRLRSLTDDDIEIHEPPRERGDAISGGGRAEQGA